MVGDVELKFLHNVLNHMEGSDLLQSNVGEDSMHD